MRLHPDKTRIVYCKDAQRRGGYVHTAFTFLGFSFRARKACGNDGNEYTPFLPGQQGRSQQDQCRRAVLAAARADYADLRLARGADQSDRVRLDEYCGSSYRGALRPLLQRINSYLMRCIRKEYRQLRGFKKASRRTLEMSRSSHASYIGFADYHGSSWTEFLCGSISGCPADRRDGSVDDVGTGRSPSCDGLRRFSL